MCLNSTFELAVFSSCFLFTYCFRLLSFSLFSERYLFRELSESKHEGERLERTQKIIDLYTEILKSLPGNPASSSYWRHIVKLYETQSWCSLKSLVFIHFNKSLHNAFLKCRGNTERMCVFFLI